MNQILIGTSGYDHVELVGSFYPEGLKRKDFLNYYSTKFNALELNSTFYGMPNSQRMISFMERSQGRLHFSVKANRLLTHEINFNWKNSAEEFKQAMKVVLDKNLLSSILFQFPESFKYTIENRFYLFELLKSFQDFPVVVEYRHRDWIRQSVFEGLSNLNAGIVFCDMPQLKNLPDGKFCGTPFIGKNAYIRLHGRNENGWYATNKKIEMDFVSSQKKSNQETSRYDYEYSLEELKSFIPIIQTAVKEGRQVQMYFNNHPKGTGTKNALQMKEMLLPKKIIEDDFRLEN